MEGCSCRLRDMQENKRLVDNNVREPKRFFDLEEIRSLPIKDVCTSFGIPVERGNFIKLRPEERTASTKLYTNNSKGHDTFKDFGSGAYGDCINLIEHWLGCSWQSALESIADTFGIQPVNNFDYEQRGILNDAQWAKIGVYGDKVAKNLDIDLEKFSPDSALKYASKYQMTVNQLREDNPNFYIAAILRNKAFPCVYGMRNAYFMTIYQEQTLQKSIAGCSKLELLSESSANDIEATRQRLTSAEKLLKLALRGTDLKFSSREYNLEKDWEDMLAGKISFEIGPNNNIEIKNRAKKDNLDVLYNKIPANDYFTLVPMESTDLPYAAFLKGDTVNLVYTSREANEMDNIFHLSQSSPEKDLKNDSKDLSSKISHAESRMQEAPLNSEISVAHR